MPLLSADILHQVFKFFVSRDQTVDGESLRVASLVCKQWKRVADSRLLWSIPVGIEGRHGNCNGDNDDADDNSRFCTVQQSLRIKETTGACSSDENPLRSSLIGFANLKRFAGQCYPDLHFLVRERATGSTFLLSISRDGKISPSLVRDLYVHHFESKEEFLRMDRNRTPERFFPSQQFPLGIAIWKGRVLRWYRCRTEMDARSTIEQISEKQKNLLHRINPSTESEQRISFVRHLVALEQTSLGDRDNQSYHHGGRQHMIDWIVEIVECFNLEDRTVFQAMLLLDRFIASPGQRIKTSHFQLVAGACISIASKCNKVFLTEKDISFCCDNIFSVANVIATEKLILKRLEWKLACPSSIEFVMAFLELLGIKPDSQMSYLCCYISELSLAFDTSYRYPPSIIAASAIVLARYTFRKDDSASLWPGELARCLDFRWKDLVECSVQLSNDAEQIRLGTLPRSSSRLDMIYRRYSKPCRHSVAEIAIPVVTSTTILTAYEARLRAEVH